VSTLCTGQAASAGSLLLCAGAKDMRFTLPNSRIMVHQPSGGFQGQATDILLHAQEIQNIKRRLNEIYVKHTGQSYQMIEDSLERDRFLTAEQAREFGLVDKVIEKTLGRTDGKKPHNTRACGIGVNDADTGRLWPSRPLPCPVLGRKSSPFGPAAQRGNRATLG